MLSVEKAEEEYQAAQAKLQEAELRRRQIREVGLLESLSKALEEMETLHKQQEENDIQVASLTKQFSDLSALIYAEISERKQQRARENETLELVRQYMKNWT